MTRYRSTNNALTLDSTPARVTSRREATDPFEGSFFDSAGRRFRWVDGRKEAWNGNVWVRDSAASTTVRDSADSGASDSRTMRQRYLAKLADNNAASLARKSTTDDEDEPVPAADSRQSYLDAIKRRNAEALK